VLATTKLVCLSRYEESEYFQHRKSANGGATWTLDGVNLMYEFGTPSQKRPPHLLRHSSGTIVIFCGNRLTGDYRIDYCTADPDDFYDNIQAGYSAVTTIYSCNATTLGADIDCGYPEPEEDSFGNVFVQAYDFSDNYVSGADVTMIKQFVITV
jgi:hypothetical protein